MHGTLNTKPNGFIFYRGPSMLDGQPIVAILTGLTTRSSNPKIGTGLYQTWILHANLHPVEAARLGADYAVCGDCKLRGRTVRQQRRLKNVDRSCYVLLSFAPSSIFKAYQRGRYPILPMSQAKELIAGGKIRGGSYGDPAAVPYFIWRDLLANTESGAAYTHQWRNFPELSSFCMASVDNSTERAEAKLLGFRTFRVRGDTLEVFPAHYEDRRPSSSKPSANACPAAAESGHKTTCDLCRACGGHDAKAKADITILVHGQKQKHFTPSVASATPLELIRHFEKEHANANQP